MIIFTLAFFFLTRGHLSGSAVFEPRSGPGDNQSLFPFKKGGLKFTSGKLWWSLHHVVKLFALCTTCRVMWLVQLVSLLPDFTFMIPGNGLLWLLIYKTRLSLDWSIVISLPLWCRHLHWEHSEIFMSCYDLKWKWLFIYTYFCTMKCHASRKHRSLQLQGWYDRKKKGKMMTLVQTDLQTFMHTSYSIAVMEFFNVSTNFKIIICAPKRVFQPSVFKFHSLEFSISSQKKILSCINLHVHSIIYLLHYFSSCQMLVCTARMLP